MLVIPWIITIEFSGGLFDLEDHFIYTGSIADFQAFSKIPQIFVEEFVKFDNLFSPYAGESWSTVQARIKQAQAIENFAKFINQDSYNLLKLASTRLSLSSENIQNCLTVAAIIAKLAGRNSLKTEDVAEALHLTWIISVYYGKFPPECESPVMP